MNIYVFERPDGALWADYSQEFAKRVGRIKRVIELKTRQDMENCIASPGEFIPDRVRALAERALAEHMARNQQPPVTRQQHDVAVAQIERWSFARRLKWLFTGS